MKKLKLNLDQLKNTEVLTRDQLRKVLGGMALGSDPTGSGGCTTDAQCAYLGPYAECIAGVCEQVSGGSSACTADTPAIYRCQSSWYGCCTDPFQSCIYSDAFGWECSY